MLTPQMIESIARSRPEFRSWRHQLMVDSGMRMMRMERACAQVAGVQVYDAAKGWGIPGRRAAPKLREGQVVSEHVQSTLSHCLIPHGISVPPVVVRYGQDYANAFFDGSYLVFGEGDGEIFGDFTSDIDVVAHELGHHVVAETCGLVYRRQSGALDEHLSDVLGVTAARLEGQSDWRLGADLFLDGVSAVRNMEKPGLAYDSPLLGKDPQVAHARDLYTGTADHGGVHVNSGIPNRAYVRACQESGDEAAVFAVWMESMKQLRPRSDFAAFVRISLDQARQNAGETVVRAVQGAWKEVGLG